ncbi:MAG: hypothetical protein MUF83_03685 [Acidimicrobiales bacterium]|jgi:hypothetical protein|nr:hypothetical protein [Acidimicrobiales bacterium]
MEVSVRRSLIWSGAVAALAASGALVANLLALFSSEGVPDDVGTQIQFLIHAGPVAGGALVVALTAAFAVVVLRLGDLGDLRGLDETTPGDAPDSDTLVEKAGHGLAGLTALGLVLFGSLGLLVDLTELFIDRSDRASGFTTGQVLAHVVMSLSVIVLAAVPLAVATRALVPAGLGARPGGQAAASPTYPPQTPGYPQQAYPPQTSQYPPQGFPPQAQQPPPAYPPPTGRPLG